MNKPRFNFINRFLRAVGKPGEDHNAPYDRIIDASRLKGKTFDECREELKRRKADGDEAVITMSELAKEVQKKYFTPTTNNLMSAFTQRFKEEMGEEALTILSDRMAQLNNHFTGDDSIQTEAEVFYLCIAMAASCAVRIELKAKNASHFN